MVRRLTAALRDAGPGPGKGVGLVLSLSAEAYATHLAANALGCQVAAARARMEPGTTRPCPRSPGRCGHRRHAAGPADTPARRVARSPRSRRIAAGAGATRRHRPAHVHQRLHRSAQSLRAHVPPGQLAYRPDRWAPVLPDGLGLPGGHRGGSRIRDARAPARLHQVLRSRADLSSCAVGLAAHRPSSTRSTPLRERVVGVRPDPLPTTSSSPYRPAVLRTDDHA
jgi:hypothetical protein